MAGDDNPADEAVGDRKGYFTTGEFAVLVVIGGLAFGVFIVGADIVRRLALSVVGERGFEWGLPSRTMVDWYLLAFVVVLSAVAAVNALRLRDADGGWTVRALVGLGVCLLGVVAAGALLLQVSAGAI